jgi:hypothetical protein
MPSWFNPAVVTFVGAILVAIGSLWQFQREASKNSEIAALNRDLASKSAEIARLTKEGMAAVLGGDSFGYLHPLFKEGGVGYFLRINPGARYPVYDTTVLVYDVTHPTQNGLLVDGEQFGTLTGVVQWRLVKALDFPAPEPGDRSKQFRVEIAARNGVLVQELRLEPKNGAWATNSRKMDWNGQPLSPPPDFPQEDLP